MPACKKPRLPTSREKRFILAADFSLKSDSADQALPQILSARQTMAEFFGFV